jgi:hypothetical protein
MRKPGATPSRGLWGDASSDLRTAGWKKITVSIGSSLFMIALVIIIVILTRLKYDILASGVASACTPDGAFSLLPTPYSYWNRSGVFQINLAFGSLSFGMAKFIDVAWDVVSTPLFSNA